MITLDVARSVAATGAPYSAGTMNLIQTPTVPAGTFSATR